MSSLVWFFLMVVAAGCALTESQEKRIRPLAVENPCAHLTDAAMESWAPRRSSSRTGDRREELSSLSPRVQAVAEILAVEDLVAEVVVLRVQRDPSDLRSLLARQAFSERMALLKFEMAGVANQLGCEQSRADHVADMLSDIQEHRRELGLIVTFIGEAILGVGGGGLLLAGEQVWAVIVEIIGGTLSVIVGGGTEFLALKCDFHHPKNLLGEFILGSETPVLFPHSVWRYLTAERLISKDERSIRDHIIARWERADLLPDPSASAEDAERQRKRRALFADKGGVYKINDLIDRSEMLEELKAYVGQMNQDLHRLETEVLQR